VRITEGPEIHNLPTPTKSAILRRAGVRTL
jgi:hypothetical protein